MNISPLVAFLLGKKFSDSSIKLKLKAVFTRLICHGSVTSLYFETELDSSILMPAAFKSIAKASALVILSSGLKDLFKLEIIQFSTPISTALHTQLLGFV